VRLEVGLPAGGARGEVKAAIDDRNPLPAEQWQEAFAAARSGQCGKVVLDWS